MPEKIKLLVVDDEELICNYVEQRFKKKGFDVLFALSGEEALVIFEKERPDIVILDIMMQGINGIETFKRIKKICPNPKVIIVSALDNNEQIEYLKTLGVSSYLTKPILLKDLDNLVVKFADEINSKI